MSMKIHYRGHGDALLVLAANGFTRRNFGNLPGGRTSDTITAETPDGALGGMVAKISGNLETDIYDGTGTIAGLYLNNANDSAYENVPAIASGKLTVMHSNGVYSVDIYETENEDGSAFASDYAFGDILYASNFGLITKENTGSEVIGKVYKAPTANDPWLTFYLTI